MVIIMNSKKIQLTFSHIKYNASIANLAHHANICHLISRFILLVADCPHYRPLTTKVPYTVHIQFMFHCIVCTLLECIMH